MSTMRKVCVISANSGACGAGGTVGGLSIVVGGNDKDRAGSFNTVAGGVRETSHGEGFLGQDRRTVVFPSFVAVKTLGLGMRHARLLSRLGSVVQSRSPTLDCMLQTCVLRRPAP